MSDENDIRRLSGSAQEFHLRLFRQTMALLVIALNASAYHILPGVFPFQILRNNMVNRHWPLSSATVLTTMAVSLYYVSLGEHNFLKRVVNVDPQSNNAGKRDAH